MMFFFFDVEIWKNVFGYDGLYEVSNYGNVRSLDRIVSMQNGKTCTFYGRIMRQAPTTRCHYLVVDLCKNGYRKHVLTHIVVAKAFFGDYDKSLEVNHIDGNIYNNHVSNLELVTHAENLEHSIRTGLKCDYGEKHVHAKLTNEQACIIRIRVANGEKQKDIADELKVSKQTINNIVHYKTYFK